MSSLVFNVNYGVMGHVDSGKTSICKKISEVSSTAAFDKNPQSQERGITLDLGFSSFSYQLPENLRTQTREKLQVTLVDCPGHASLIKTVIGASKIIDSIILVIDATHGIQVQTAECLIIAQILKCPLIIALNKVDLLAPEINSKIEKVEKKLRAALKSTIFSDCPIVPVTCKDDMYVGAEIEQYSWKNLKEAIVQNFVPPTRLADGPFLFSVDHCFGVKGHGTVLTGTVISGSIKVGQEIEIVGLSTNKRIKSIQVFKQPCTKISQGDRAGIAINQFDPKLLERGLVTCCDSPLKHVSYIIIKMNPIKYYKKDIKSRKNVLLSVGFEIVTGNITLFESSEKYEDFSLEREYKSLESINSANVDFERCFCLIKLEKPVICLQKTLVMGIKLNTTPDHNTCRLMFHGETLNEYSEDEYLSVQSMLKIYNLRCREGKVIRGLEDKIAIVVGLFGPNVPSDIYTSLKVKFSTGEDGIIEGSFGQIGKLRVRITSDKISEQLNKAMKSKTPKNRNKHVPNEAEETVTVTLNYKKYLFRNEGSKKYKQ